MKLQIALLQLVMAVACVDSSQQGAVSSLLGLKTLASSFHLQHTMTPNPNLYQLTYEDGTKTPLINVKVREGRGNAYYVHLFEETIDGFTVNHHSEDGKYTYLDVDEDSGELIDTGLVAGIEDHPFSANIHKDALKISEEILEKNSPTRSSQIEDYAEDGVHRKLRGSLRNKRKNPLLQNGVTVDQHEWIHDHDVDVQRRVTITSGTLKNLVISFKFSDHSGRQLPSRSDLDILMNNEGYHPLSPSGSVRDVYLQNSFNNLDLESSVLDWVTIDYTEAYCADGIQHY